MEDLRTAPIGVKLFYIPISLWEKFQTKKKIPLSAIILKTFTEES
jgi:hypothetical protein